MWTKKKNSERSCTICGRGFTKTEQKKRSPRGEREELLKKQIVMCLKEHKKGRRRRRPPKNEARRRERRTTRNKGIKCSSLTYIFLLPHSPSTAPTERPSRMELYEMMSHEVEAFFFCFGSGRDAFCPEPSGCVPC